MRTVFLRFLGSTKHLAFNLAQRVGTYQLGVGDIITLPAYKNAKAQVMKITSDEYNYIDITDQYLSYDNPCRSKNFVIIKSVEYFPSRPAFVQKPAITIQEARKLYIQGGEFRDIALRFYKEKELTAMLSPITPQQAERLQAMESLQVLANYYNDGWEKKQGVNGYFCNYNSENDKWEVLCHCKVTYPGIIYFKEKQDAQNALRSIARSELDALVP